MIQNDQSLFGSTTLSSGTLAAATKARKAPIGRAYDFNTNKAVDNATDFFVPGRGAELLSQWHLTRLGDLGRVWQDFTGSGVKVGVYDEGVQAEHWDLAANYDASNHVVIDGQPFYGQPGAHGTSAAGLIAAARNGRGGVGVAYDAKVTGVAIFDTDGAAYFTKPGFMTAALQMNRFDVTSHSWGSTDFSVGSVNSRNVDGTFASFMAGAAKLSADTGRQGLGTITVAAAGNSSIDQQADGWKTDRHATAVAAYREADGVASSYSSHGPHILVSAPSNDFPEFGGSGLVTTDLLGTAGYNMLSDPRATSDYTDQFGGTSGATPIVSGVVSLMLDANENLGWRDVKNILAASAKMPVAFETGPVVINAPVLGDTFRLNEDSFRLGNDAANWNGGGMHYSNDYGYGAVDAYAAARMAEVWGLFGEAKTSRNEVAASTGVVPVNVTADSNIEIAAYPDKLGIYRDITGAPARFTFEVGEKVDVEHLDLSINFKNLVDVYNAPGGKLLNSVTALMMVAQIKLIAPDGTSAFSYQQGQIDLASASENFVFGLSGFRGAETKGTWTIEFQSFDLDFRPLGGFYDNKLTINSLKLDMYGSAPTNDDVYTYTNEFFTMLDIKGERSRATLNDTDGGDDWINAAAVSDNVNVSLVGGQATTFGGDKAFTIGRSSVIENVVTGDGNDTLIGNRFDNFLVAMRGNDTLNGGAGNDWLFGGTGNDKFLFDNAGTSGKDLVLDFNRGDLIGTQTALRGAGTDGKITVAASTLLLLDGTRNGDTVQLSQQGGAVLQVAGQKDGYYWYSFVSGTDIKMGDVIREESFQPELAGSSMSSVLAAMAGGEQGSASAAIGDVGASLTGPVGEQGSFYLYDAMAGSMSGGVLLHA